MDIYFQLAEGKAIFNNKKLEIMIDHPNNNVIIKTLGNNSTKLNRGKVCISYDYLQKSKQPALIFETQKTIIYPISTLQPKILEKLLSSINTEVRINININNKNTIKCKLVVTH